MDKLQIEVRPLELSHLTEAAHLLSLSMSTNPLNIAAAGSEAKAAANLERIFHELLKSQVGLGSAGGAFYDGKLVGVCGCFPPHKCQASVVEKVKMLPLMMSSLGVFGTKRMLSWFGKWSAHDPRQPHWHLGPIAVLPKHQGQGVGSAMLVWFCDRADAKDQMAYLETDKHSNVEFYSKHGFSVTDKADVIGVQNWFMSRPPAGKS